MKYVILSVLICLAAGPAYGGKWFELESKRQNGRYIDGLYIDLGTIQQSGLNTFTVDIVEDYPVVPATNATKGYSADTIIDRYEIDCSTGSQRQLFEIHYYKQQVVGVEEFHEDFKKIMEKNGKAVLKQICK